MDPLGTHKRKRKEILRGVYEENMRISDQEPPPSDGPSRSLLGGLVVLVVLAGLIGAGFAIQHVNSSEATPADMANAENASSLPLETLLTQASAEGTSGSFEDSLAPAANFSSLTAGGEPSLAALFGLEIQTIVLDPGHGGRDPGAVGTSGTYEKDIAMDVSRRLMTKLERHGLQVRMTRTEDATVPLQERAHFANSHEADLFISIHVNKLPDASVSSVETYYFGAGSDARARRLARQENRGSDYSIADFRRIIDQLENTLRLQESQHLASSIQSELFSTLSSDQPELANWGVKTAPFVVLLGTEAPSILTEIGVLSHPESEQNLQTDRYREQIAGALEQGILLYLQRRASTQPLELAQQTTHYGS